MRRVATSPCRENPDYDSDRRGKCLGKRSDFSHPRKRGSRLTVKEIGFLTRFRNVFSLLRRHAELQEHSSASQAGKPPPYQNPRAILHFPSLRVSREMTACDHLGGHGGLARPSPAPHWTGAPSPTVRRFPGFCRRPCPVIFRDTVIFPTVNTQPQETHETCQDAMAVATRCTSALLCTRDRSPRVSPSSRLIIKSDRPRGGKYRTLSLRGRCLARHRLLRRKHARGQPPPNQGQRPRRLDHRRHQATIERHRGDRHQRRLPL